MTDRPIMNSPEPVGPANFLDAYMPPQVPSVQQRSPQMLNISDLRGLLYRQRWLVAAVVFAAAVIGLTVTLLTTPMYEATSKVSVKPFGEQVVEGGSDSSMPSNLVFEYIETMIQRIKSRQLAEVVVDDLKLAERQDLLGKNVDENRAPGLTDDQWRDARRQMAISAITGSLSVEATQGFVIDIGVRSANPILAAEVANAYANAFVASDTRSSVESSRYALTYLTEQIEQTRVRLQTAD